MMFYIVPLIALLNGFVKGAFWRLRSLAGVETFWLSWWQIQPKLLMLAKYA